MCIRDRSRKNSAEKKTKAAVTIQKHTRGIKQRLKRKKKSTKPKETKKAPKKIIKIGLPSGLTQQEYIAKIDQLSKIHQRKLINSIPGAVAAKKLNKKTTQIKKDLKGQIIYLRQRKKARQTRKRIKEEQSEGVKNAVSEINNISILTQRPPPPPKNGNNATHKKKKRVPPPPPPPKIVKNSAMNNINEIPRPGVAKRSTATNFTPLQTDPNELGLFYKSWVNRPHRPTTVAKTSYPSELQKIIKKNRKIIKKNREITLNPGNSSASLDDVVLNFSSLNGRGKRARGVRGKRKSGKIARGKRTSRRGGKNKGTKKKKKIN